MLPELKEEFYIIVEENIKRTGFTRNSVIFFTNMAGLIALLMLIIEILFILTVIITTIMNLIK